MSNFEDKTDNLASIKLIELINDANVSVRLRNSINCAAKERTLPFETLGEFRAARGNAEALLLKIPNLGQKTVKEFIDLVNTLATHNNLEATPENIVSTTRNKSLARSNEFFNLFKEGFSYKDISELHNISEATVRMCLNDHPEFNPAMEKQNRRLNQASAFLKLYCQGLSYKDIADRHQLSEATVRKILSEHPEFEPKISPINAAKERRRLEKSNQFLELYKQGLTYQAIGEKFNITRERVRQLLTKNPAFHEYLDEYESAKAAEERAKEEQRQRKLDQGSISYRYPERVCELWDYDKNGEVSPDTVQAGNTLIYIWLKCPFDGYSWKKKPSEITRYSWDKGTSGCPACIGRTKRPEKQPSLLDSYAEFVSEYWDYGKNDAIGVNPALITLASNRKVWFKCPHDGHEWQAKVFSTVKQQWAKGNAGCRVCNGTINRNLGTWKHRDPISIEFPDEIAKYWDYEKNNELKIYPNKVTGGSAKKVWFTCPEDGFEWFSAIAPTVQNWKVGRSGCSRCGKGWTMEAIRQFVSSLEKHIPNLTQAERYKIFEQAGVLNATGAESLNLVKDIIKGKLSGQKLYEFVRGKESKASELNQDVTEDISGNEEFGFLDADSKLETSNIVDSRVEYSEPSDSSDELPTVKVKNSLEFLSSQIVASADQEAIDYFVASRRNRIWAEIFVYEAAVEAVESFTDEGYGRQVRDQFLDEYYQARDMPIPTG